MRKTIYLWPVLFLVLSSLACTITVPGISLPRVPTLEVGPMQEYREAIPLGGTTAARVEITMGMGELTLAAGEPDLLFSGLFRTNISAWKPEVTWKDDVLKIAQPDIRGVPGAGAENEWNLTLSPRIPMSLKLQVGAAKGRLDLGGLALTDLSLETGASDMLVRWDTPNAVPMDRLLLRAGAANVEVRGIGYAHPRDVRVEGGVGNLVLDFTGPWADSARVNVTAGLGSLTLRFPRDVGARIRVEGGLSNVTTTGDWRLSEGVYLNEAYGQAGATLEVTITAGVGGVTLESE
ncbi:MAG: toast rack family protein [Anaerolineae bacterium]